MAWRSWVLQIVAAWRFDPRRSASSRSARSRPASSRFAFTKVAPLILAFSLPGFLDVPAASYTGWVWVGLAWAVAVSSFCGWLMWTWVNAVRGVARSAPFNYLMPPIAGFVAWLTLGEAFTWLKVGGAVVTMAGVAYAQFAGGPPPKEAGQPDSA